MSSLEQFSSLVFKYKLLGLRRGQSIIIALKDMNRYEILKELKDNDIDCFHKQDIASVTKAEHYIINKLKKEG
jgi:hypothetical protein